MEYDRCDRSGESIFSPRAGESRTFCINFCICEHCGAVLSGVEFVGMATDNTFPHGDIGVSREYRLISPRPFHCGCAINSVFVHNKLDGIPTGIEFTERVSIANEKGDAHGQETNDNG